MPRTGNDRPFNLMPRVLAAIGILFIAVPAPAADAADASESQLSSEQQARLDARLDEIRTRLDLSDDQRERLEPLLRKDLERRVEVLRKHGMTREPDARPSARQMRAARRDLKLAREQTEAEMKQILDERQFDEYRKIQQEARDEMRERVRSRSADQS